MSFFLALGSTLRSNSLETDFLEGRLGAKELAGKVKAGIVTVEQLLGLWKTELRPLQLYDYYPLAAYQPGPSKHSKIMADVLVSAAPAVCLIQCVI